MSPTFDTSFLKHDRGPERARYGAVWEVSELEELKQAFLKGVRLKGLCEALERPASGILTKLCNPLGVLSYDTTCCSYHYTNRALKALAEHGLMPAPCNEPQPQPQPKKEATTMKTITITNQTLVNGRNVKDLTDSELFSLIAEQEAHIEELSKIKAQPKRLKDEIAKRQQAVLDLVALLDKEA